MQENIVESEESIFNLGLGFLPVRNRFFAVNHYKTDKIYRYEPNVALWLTLNMDPDIIIYTREVETFWDFFGDIGGLLQIMSICGGFLVNFSNMLAGKSLDSHLISQLFFIEKESKPGRKRARLDNRSLLMCSQKNHRKLFERGKSMIEDQLDLVKFVRQLLLLRTGHKMIFSSNERYLMRH